MTRIRSVIFTMDTLEYKEIKMRIFKVKCWSFMEASLRDLLGKMLIQGLPPTVRAVRRII